MYKTAKQGWYRVINTDKVIKPIDNRMNSFRINENGVEFNYKSSLELKTLRYCDYNKHVIRYSLEPFSIKYVKPTDGKIHSYFIDFFIEFSNKKKFLVEIKPKSQTVPPKKPKNASEKSIYRYQCALQTFAINQAKWNAAKEFATSKEMSFIVLTDEEIN